MKTYLATFIVLNRISGPLDPVPKDGMSDCSRFDKTSNDNAPEIGPCRDGLGNLFIGNNNGIRENTPYCSTYFSIFVFILSRLLRFFLQKKWIYFDVWGFLSIPRISTAQTIKGICVPYSIPMQNSTIWHYTYGIPNVSHVASECAI